MLARQDNQQCNIFWPPSTYGAGNKSRVGIEKSKISPKSRKKSLWKTGNKHESCQNERPLHSSPFLKNHLTMKGDHCSETTFIGPFQHRSWFPKCSCFRKLKTARFRGMRFNNFSRRELFKLVLLVSGHFSSRISSSSH